MKKKDLTDAILSGRLKKPLPILSYPGNSFFGHTIKELLSDSTLQAQTIKAVADRCDTAAAVTLMDLSVEAECFGAAISDDENSIPAVKGALIGTPQQIKELTVPKVGIKRSGIFIDTVKKAKELVTDRPLLAGCAGPFSLAGRLTGITEAMLLCFDDPGAAQCLLDKCTEFIIAYAKELKNAGADGIIIAEPVAGLLSPAMEEEFCAPYVKKISAELRSDDFFIVYHNCGQNVGHMTESVFSNGCDAYHFGEVSDMSELLELAPKDKIILGNISPVDYFRDGSPEDMTTAVRRLLDSCGKYPNFVLSSGCDIPPSAKWENIDAFFKEAEK